MLEKVDLKIDGQIDKNIAYIKQGFPSVITETQDENGKIVEKIDFEKLKQELSDQIIEGKEAYNFTWPGKKKAILEANTPTDKTLRPCREESVNFDTTKNLYIEGDNLEMLKLLQNSYFKKVKMIYIDPPYNTGNDFIYNDKFTMDSEEYEEATGLRDEDGDIQFKQNKTSNPRYHSDWCTMMYSRLKLARNLLTDDGVIFISIDDIEQANLKKICDEVFGAGGFVSCLKIKTGSVFGTKAAHVNKTFVKSGEYCIVYNKNIYNDENNIKQPLFDKAEILYDSHYNSVITTKQGEYIRTPILSYITNNYKYKKYFDDYKMNINFTNINILLNISQEFKSVFYSEIANILFMDSPLGNQKDESFKNLEIGKIYLYNKNLIFKTSGNKIRMYKSYFDSLHYTDGYISSFDRTFYRGDFWLDFSQDMANIQDEGDITFDNGKKPVRLIKNLAKWMNDKNDIILDFFSGSATTAHAVMQLNAEDGGKRKFILVNLPEECKEDSEAYKQGFKNICEIGKERIRRAGKKIKEEFLSKKDITEEEKQRIENLDIGFRVLKLDSNNMIDTSFTPGETTQDLLSRLQENIKSDRNSEDLLYACLIKFALEFNIPYEIKDVDGFKIYVVNENELVACFDKNITMEVVEAMADLKPMRVVFRDNSFATSADRINAEQIFKYRSPETDEKDIVVI